MTDRPHNEFVGDIRRRQYHDSTTYLRNEATRARQRVYISQSPPTEDTINTLLYNIFAGECVSGVAYPYADPGNRGSWMLLRGSSFPSMCGGRLIVAGMVDEGDLFNEYRYELRRLAHMPDNFSAESMFRNARSGIIGYVNLDQQYTHATMVRDGLLRLFGESDMVSVAEYTSRFDDIVWAHCRNEEMHDEYHGSPSGRRQCHWCGRFISSSGYCSWCGEYVSNGRSRTDDRDVQCKDDWIAKAIREGDYDPAHHAMPRARISVRLSNHRRANDDMIEFGRSFENGAVKVLTNWKMPPRKRSAILGPDDAVDYLAMLIDRAGVMNGPVVISSNVGEPLYPPTAWAMATLIKHKDEFEKRGLIVISPDDMGTNPNEGYHYIDSVAVATAEGY